MTEQEWLACADPGRMIRHLQKTTNGWPGHWAARVGWTTDKLSQRKLRLLREEIALHFHMACPSYPWADKFPFAPVQLEWDCTEYSMAITAGVGIDEQWDTVAHLRLVAGMPAFHGFICGVIHELFGNPFRPIIVERSWLSWHDAAARRIAQRIYDDQRFQDLPILADALEEAGCTDEQMLGHCRGGRVHVRGCWVIDLAMGRE